MNTRRGFTLIELLLVMAIMTVVISHVAPAVNGIFQGYQMTQAGQVVSGQFGMARQIAITQNRSVEVRFYKYGDPESSVESMANPGTWRFQAIQVLMISESGKAVPLGKVERLPQGVVMDGGAVLSSIFDPSKRSYTTAPTTPIPRVNASYSYYAIRIRPDGSTDLSPTINGNNQLWFVTLHNRKDGDNLDAPPPNFFTIQIDPINGAMTNFRP